jgi:hypothetical protein
MSKRTYLTPCQLARRGPLQQLRRVRLGGGGPSLDGARAALFSVRSEVAVALLE